MMLDWRLVLERWPLVLLLTTLPVLLFKLALITGWLHAGRASWAPHCAPACIWPRPVDWLCAADDPGGQTIWCHRTCSTPFWRRWCCPCWPRPSSSWGANPLVTKLVGSDWLMQSVQMTQIASKSMGAKATSSSAAIAAAARTARLLDKANDDFPHRARPDPDRAPAAAGDSPAMPPALAARQRRGHHLHRHRQCAEGAGHIQHLAPDARGGAHAGRCEPGQVAVRRGHRSGAEAIEASLMLASHALALVGVPMRKVLRMVQEQRETRYNLRAATSREDDQGVDALDDEHLSTFRAAPGASHGQALSDLELEALGVRVVSVRSHGKTTACTPTPCSRKATPWYSAASPALALAEDRLVAGG